MEFTIEQILFYGCIFIAGYLFGTASGEKSARSKARAELEREQAARNWMETLKRAGGNDESTST